MAKPTERALRRKPKAVILLTTLRADVPKVPDGNGGREFEWFTTQDGMENFFNQNIAFHQEDCKEHDDMAYLAVEIEDTASAPMTLGRIDVQPEDDAKCVAWMESIKEDVTRAFFQPPQETTEETKTAAKVVRPRRKSTAASVVKKKAPEADSKAAALKARLDAKKTTPSTTAKKAVAKKVSPAKETPYVVKKAAVDPNPASKTEDAQAS